MPLGIARRRRRASAPDTAAAMADVVLRDHTGADVRLGSLWAERPAVLAFLRHFGWVFCRAHAVQLHRDRPEFERAGVELVAIGNGTVEQAAAFVRSQGLDGLRLVVDPERRVYEAAGARVGTLSQLVGPRVMLAGSRRTAGGGGARQGRVIGHAAQLGGVLIVAPDGSVPYSYLAENASDLAPQDEVLAAARRAAAAAA